MVALGVCHCLCPGHAGGEDGTALVPGLRADYFASSEPSGAPAAVRADDALRFDWAADPPDLRLAAGPFAARWTGALLAPDDGEYRFLVHVSGAVRVRLGGEVIAEGERAAAGWVEGSRVALEYDYHPIEVEFRATVPRARIALFWEAPGVGLEPLPVGSLFHASGPAVTEGSAGDASAAAGAFEDGLRVVRRLRCGACHEIPGAGSPPRAPSLVAAAAIEPGHLLRKVLASGEAAPGSRMPELRLAESEARAAIAFLRARSRPPAASGDDDGSAAAGAGRGTDEEKLVSHGRRRVLSRGCLACHRLDGLGAADGIALDHAGARRPRAAIARWLASPRDAADRTVHRPDLDLDGKELAEVAAFLASRGGPAPRPTDREEPAPVALVERGAAVLVERRCGACHELPEGVGPAAPASPLHRGRAIDWTRSCLERGDGASPRPYYVLGDRERRAVEAFLGAVSPQSRLSAFDEGGLLLEEHGCLRCHPRDGGEGLAASIGELIAAEPLWTGLEGALRPPSLAAAGDKFRDEALRDAIAGRAARRRPWLEARMPRFLHSEAEERALLAFLAGRDRVPARDGASRATVAPGEVFAAGHRLVGAGGFSCVSCHVVGSFTPGGVAPNVRGPDLLRPGERLRRQWFLRWMRDPSRMAPGIEMPAIAVGFPGVLGGDRERQLEALWEALDSESFPAPAHSATERELVVAPGERPVVIRDVFQWRPPYGGGWTPRALAVGFGNGQSVAIDLSSFAPVAWWHDGLARQFTVGKSWFWEPAGAPVLPRLPPVGSIALRREGSLRLPVRVDQTTGWLESWERPAPDRVAFAYRLRVDGGWLRVREVFAPIGAAGSDRRGIERAITVDGFAAGSAPAVLLAVPADASPRPRGEAVLVESSSGPARITAPGAEWEVADALAGAPDGSVVLAAPCGVRDGAARATLRYELLAPGQLAGRPAVEIGLERSERELLDLVPGFEAVRLPLPRAVMPTSFAFGADGAVFFTSLKGDLFRLVDRDGDGLGDECVAIADFLSAPFGLAADGRDLVVSHKPELVRLRDRDGDGLVDRAEVIATGWGFSHDYHDWTFGLVRRDDGWVVLTGSDYQQNGRAPESTALRGKAVRISADGATEVIARGLRFTVGLAANAEGEVFFTDNQGEGNTFNEIDHLRPGKLYGVPSLYDPAADRRERGEPPAIQVPHPWTRSVNGIAFLAAGGRFGPFEGHGIGCEYDNRKLIRFSLERVGETYQGACYPLSREGGEPGFLGPVACGVARSGDIYIGSMKDSGWGGGANVGEVVVLRPASRVPFGIREVRARARGFEVDWTAPCDPDLAARPESWTLSAYRRVWRGGYSTPDSDRHRVEVKGVRVREDRMGVVLEAAPLREGFVFEIHVRRVGPGDEAPWPASAYYTLNRLPRG